jgi:nitrogen fixation protein NifB
LINQHLGHAETLYIYAKTPQGILLREIRPTPATGSGPDRWHALSELLHDCRALLVSAIGNTPCQVLEGNGMHVLVVEGVIADAVQAIYEEQSLAHLQKRPSLACSGSGGGCGG